MIYEVVFGSGRATCGVCHKIITKEEMQVISLGNQQSGRAHLKCINNLAKKVKK